MTETAKHTPLEAELLAVLRESVKQLDTIIEDGTPTDFTAWRDDINACLARAQGKAGD